MIGAPSHATTRNTYSAIVVLIHKADGKTVGGMLELPTGWDKPGFEGPHGPRSMNEAVHVYVGTHSAEETHKLGIKLGDWLTIPKEYRRLLGTRANVRSFDDRVGCAALIEAVKAFGPNLLSRLRIAPHPRCPVIGLLER